MSRLEAIRPAARDARASGLDAPRTIADGATPTSRERLFVVSAHPDDDVIGCGGTIARAMLGGAALAAVYVTDGSGSHPRSVRYDASALRTLREAEARDALAILGANVEPAFYRLPDGGLATISSATRAAAVARLAASIAAFEPTLVLSPWRRDPHADHRAASRLTADAVGLAGYGGAAGEYEVWLMQRAADGDAPHAGEVRTAVTHLGADLRALKRRAILAHRSQTSDLIDDDPTAFRIDAEMLDRWTGPEERIHYALG